MSWVARRAATRPHTAGGGGGGGTPVTQVQQLIGTMEFTNVGGNRYAGAVTAGNLLVASIQLYGNGPTATVNVTGVSDNIGQTWTIATASQVTIAGADYYMKIVYAYFVGTVAGALPTVTVNLDNTVFNVVDLYELTPGHYDQSSTATGTNPSAVGCGTITPTENGAFAIAAVNLDSSGSPAYGTVPSGWTYDQNGAAGSGSTASAHIAQTTAAALAPVFVSAPGTGGAVSCGSMIDFVP